MSDTRRSKLDSHRKELRYRPHRGKHSLGTDKRLIPCNWCLQDISRLERERKDLERKYPKKAINLAVNS